MDAVLPFKLVLPVLPMPVWPETLWETLFL